MRHYKRNRTLATLIFLVLVLVAAYFLYQRPAKAPESAEQAASSPTSTPEHYVGTPPPAPVVPASSAPAASPKAAAPAATGTKQAQGTYSSGESNDTGSNISVWEIDYDGSKFTPPSINISVNDYVFFKNQSKINSWPISSPATAYPAFDAGQNILPGKEFKFQFTQIGKWNFTDKLNPVAVGTVTVSK